MDKTVYVCTGTCQAKITEEQYNNGLTQCGADSCTMKDHTFEKRKECSQCGATYKEDEQHNH